MIGPGVVARAVAAVALAGVPFALRPGPAFLADPPRFAHGVAAANGALADARAQVDTALTAVTAAIDATRKASISASTGASLDEARFGAAASAVRASAGPIAAAAAAMQRARGVLGPFGIRLGPLGTDGDRTAGIGDGVDAARASAGGFIALRTNATAVLEALRRSAMALGRGDATGASAAADEAAAALDLVRPNASTLPELRLWLETTSDLLATVREAVTALRNGDHAAAITAQRRLADAAEEAAVSDRALGLAVSEGAGRVLGTPLLQLATQARALVDAQGALDAAGAGLLALDARDGAPLAP
jgi:hypothetical protein